MFNALRHNNYTAITSYPVSTVLKILYTYCRTDSMDISSSRPQRLAGSINNNTPTVTTMSKSLSRTTSLWTTSDCKKTQISYPSPFLFTDLFTVPSRTFTDCGKTETAFTPSRNPSRNLHGPSRIPCFWKA